MTGVILVNEKLIPTLTKEHTYKYQLAFPVITGDSDIKLEKFLKISRGIPFIILFVKENHSVTNMGGGEKAKSAVVSGVSGYAFIKCLQRGSMDESTGLLQGMYADLKSWGSVYSKKSLGNLSLRTDSYSTIYLNLTLLP